MVAVVIDHHFVVHQLGNAPGCLPVEVQPNVGLLQFVKMIIYNDVCAALQAVFHVLFKSGQFTFSHLRNIVGNGFTIFIEISIEIGSLVLLPLELTVLYPVLSKFHSIHLGE